MTELPNYTLQLDCYGFGKLLEASLSIIEKGKFDAVPT